MLSLHWRRAPWRDFVRVHQVAHERGSRPTILSINIRPPPSHEPPCRSLFNKLAVCVAIPENNRQNPGSSPPPRARALLGSIPIKRRRTVESLRPPGSPLVLSISGQLRGRRRSSAWWQRDRRCRRRGVRGRPSCGATRGGLLRSQPLRARPGKRRIRM